MKSRKMNIVLIIINVILIGIICSFITKDRNLVRKQQIIKEMSETEYESQVQELNKSHKDYATYIENCKISIATAITKEGVSTSAEDTLENMANNIGKILQVRTSDATATADNITAGKTAWINGKLITGNGADNKVGYLGNDFVLTNVGTGTTYTASKEEKILVVASVLYIQNGGNWQYPGVTIKKNGTALSNQSIALNLDSIFGNYGMRAQSIVVFNVVSLSNGDTLNLSFTNSSSNGVRLYRLEQ